MKKTILALAVPALMTAGAANATFSLYDANGVVVNLSGKAGAQYMNKYDGRAKNTAGQDPYLKIDKAEFLLATSHVVTDSLNVVAGMGFKFKGDTLDKGNVENNQLYVGFGSNYGTLTFGRQVMLADKAGNSKAYGLGKKQVNFLHESGAQVIKWVYDNGRFYAGANVDLDNNVNRDKNGREVVGGRVGMRVDALDARVYVFNGEKIKSSEFAPTGTALQNVSGFNLETDYKLGKFDASASYGQVRYENSNAKSNHNHMNLWQLSSTYKMDERISVGLGYDIMDSHTVGSYEKYNGNNLYTNVTYKIHDNTKVFAEIGTAHLKKGSVTQDTDIGYGVGMRVTF
ncbi:porin [Candidatus Enterovibrio altilux]|uniref:porin n=1 Tax=Candidatus Enterovibrio altilux TaxID=1927128 RepID=UPI0012381C1C|nr:porin [Candidatus Enterovibrio luxaltus]